jgi:hypothetical protein
MFLALEALGLETSLIRRIFGRVIPHGGLLTSVYILVCMVADDSSHLGLRPNPRNNTLQDR